VIIYCYFFIVEIKQPTQPPINLSYKC